MAFSLGQISELNSKQNLGIHVSRLTLEDAKILAAYYKNLDIDVKIDEKVILAQEQQNGIN